MKNKAPDIMDKNMTSKGFTLIELAVVILIIGFLSIPLFQMYNVYLIDKRILKTRENIETMQTAISSFVILNKRYPCPADRSLSPAETGFGLENCTLAAASPLGGCSASPVTGTDSSICRLPSEKFIPATNPNPEEVYMGAVPIVTLVGSVGLATATENSLDGWGNKLTYAVSAALTSVPTYNINNGAISIIDEFGNRIGGTPANPEFQHYTIISHGEDGQGGFTLDGQPLQSCASGMYGPGGPAPVPGDPLQQAGMPSKMDIENCNTTNARFVQTLGFNKTEGLSFYDDMMAFGSSSTSTLWAEVYAMSGGTVQKTQHIRNVNTGNVGIQVQDPSVSLDVGGSITNPSALADVRASTQVRSPTFCSKDGTKCFSTETLTRDTTAAGSPGIRCPAGQIMTGISNAQATCTNITFPASGSWTYQTCTDPAKPWLKSIKSDGTIECSQY